MMQAISSASVKCRCISVMNASSIAVWEVASVSASATGR
jgi:hypothetical protein